MCVPPLPPAPIPPAQSAQRLTGNYDSRTHLAGSVVKSNGEQTLEKHWIPRLRLTTQRLRSQTRDAPSNSTLGVTLMLNCETNNTHYPGYHL
uniref:Uncharacterized protein n=1 Tax=Timema monikensis TaxID=170555 RepID=A0A7R9EHF5_9NEOP|nr:unnamed protein product [Timema monikensis]